MVPTKKIALCPNALTSCSSSGNVVNRSTKFCQPAKPRRAVPSQSNRLYCSAANSG